MTRAQRGTTLLVLLPDTAVRTAFGRYHMTALVVFSDDV